jgi:hypothetical protein
VVPQLPPHARENLPDACLLDRRRGVARSLTQRFLDRAERVVALERPAAGGRL